MRDIGSCRMTDRRPAIRRVTGLGLAALAMALAGCSAGGPLSLSAEAPDETLVLARAPLSLPSDIELSPPVPGAPSLVEPQPLEDARRALGGVGSAPAPALSQTEQLLINSAGPADPDVRTALTEESGADVERDFGLETFFGFEVPATLEEARNGGGRLAPREELNALRETGAATPTAPPAPPDPNRGEDGGFRIRGTF